MRLLTFWKKFEILHYFTSTPLHWRSLQFQCYSINSTHQIYPFNHSFSTCILCFFYLHILIRKWQSSRMMFRIEWRWTYPRARCFMSRIKLKTRAVCEPHEEEKNEILNRIHTNTLLHTNMAHSSTFKLLILWPLDWIFTGFRWSSIFRPSSHFTFFAFA